MWALYGNATWTKQGGVLLGDGCPHMRVRLLFQADGNRWQITRALKRRQDGTPGAASAELTCIDGDRPAVDSVRLVNAAVERLLGLDWDAFTCTVVLPQGQFARLLTDTDVDRMRILAQIWRTEELVEARRQADEAHRELDSHLGYLRGRRQGYPADFAGELTAARKAAAKAAKAAAQMEKAALEVERCQQAAEKARVMVRTLGKATNRLREALAGDIVAEASTLVVAASDLDKQLRPLDELLAKQERRLKVLEGRSHDKGPDRETTKAATRSLEGLNTSLVDMADRIRGLDELRSEAGKRKKEAAALKKAADKADTEVVAAEENLDRWRRVDAAGTAAHGLHPGDDCPICARRLVDGWEAPDASGLEGALERHRSSRKKAEDARGHHREKTTEASEVHKQVDQEAARLAERFKTFAETVAKLPESFRPIITDLFAPDAIRPEDLTEALLADARSAAAAREEKFVAWETELNKVRDEIHRLREEQLDLHGRKHTEVTEPSSAIRARLDSISERLRAYEDAGVALPLALPPLWKGIEQLDADTSAVVKAAEAAMEAAEGATQKADDDLAANEADLARFLIAVQAESVEDLTNRQVGARAEAMRAQDRLEELKRFKPIVEALDKHLVEGGATLGALSDLKTVLQDGRFIRWLTLRRSRALLAVASMLLGEMTGGRYAFADITDEHDEWRIFDNETGYARSPRTLSGGESFVASLALALGMVEMVARSGGRLDALFLDEGFGALDPENLDAAIDALESSAIRGRMVAVISHVPAVAERLAHVLAVQRTPSGSQASWLDSAGRDALAASDAAESVRGMVTQRTSTG